MERVEKVATPPEALTVVVPESVPPPGFVPIANVTDAVLVGAWPNTSCVAAPGCTVNVELVPAVNVGVPLVWVAVSDTPLSALV